jgi:hypothetical protein
MVNTGSCQSADLCIFTSFSLLIGQKCSKQNRTATCNAQLSMKVTHAVSELLEDNCLD